MSLGSGFISANEMLAHLRLTARCQNGPTARRLRNGLLIPPYGIPDHINFDGSPVFYPGTYSAGEDQGTGVYGILPPVDDQYEFVHIAWRAHRASGSAAFLRERIDSMLLYERLVAAFDAPRVDPQTEMIVTSTLDRAVGSGFCDTVHLTGKLLFPSLLRYRAAGELITLSGALGKTDSALRFKGIRATISRHLPTVFKHSSANGWLAAATGVGRQPDVWGTVYAFTWASWTVKPRAPQCAA
jgi:hypothetical protein